MTINELRSKIDHGFTESVGSDLYDLAPQILALVEAATRESRDWDLEGNETLAALDAFSAKLAQL